MQQFEFYVTDDRYGVASLVFIQTKDEPSARSLAERMLTNAHYHAIEVWRGKHKLFSLNDLDPSQA